MRLSITLSLAVISVVFPAPALASAQGEGLTGVLGTFSNLLNGLIGLLITLALIIFFWGLIRYLSAGGAEGSSEGLKIMFWGAMTLFVMVSIWGIIKLVQVTFGVGNATIEAPGGFIYEAPRGSIETIEV